MWGAAIDEGRRLAESLMIDTCTITGPATVPVFNETTGLYSSTPGAAIYSGICKRQTVQRFEQTSTAGAHAYSESRLQLHLPMAADGVATPKIPKGSVVTMTACPKDPANVGQRLFVEGPAGKTLGTAQKLNVTEVVG